MATCAVDDLLEQAKCFVGLPGNVVLATQAALWCDISGGITPVPPVPDGGWWNPDVGAPIVNPDEGDGIIVNPDV